MRLPNFRYHPDPIKTGSIIIKDIVCICCNKNRTHCYAGPIYCTADIESESVCPWCIDDGTLHKKFGATTVASITVENGAQYSDIPDEVKDIIYHRTPSFIAYQEEEWLTHCNDGCAYLGIINGRNLESFPKDARDALWNVCQDSDDPQWHYEWLFEVDGDGSACLFQCLHCQKHLSYWDLN